MKFRICNIYKVIPLLYICLVTFILPLFLKSSEQNDEEKHSICLRNRFDDDISEVSNLSNLSVTLVSLYRLPVYKYLMGGNL